ncbi:MAG: nuclear transport factor 2 family protein [Bacteroidetes bacterium]|nr:nuclear transport factor 2 family protein [Bacteroidota bacterium]
MKKRKGIIGLLTLGVVLLAVANYAQTSKSVADNKAIIREQIDDFVKAFRTRDLNLMMSLYAPGMVAFDIVPPLQDMGADTYRNTWEKTFKQFYGPINIETRDLKMVTGDHVAFSYMLVHVRAAMVNGQKVDFWERMTLGFQKVNGKWLIMHEHVSVPAELATGKAALNLKP